MSVDVAITVRPPWSQIIAEAEALTALGVNPKLVENRGQGVAAKHIGTDIAIHAGRSWDQDGARDIRVLRAWKTFAEAIGLREPNPLLAAIGDTRTGYVGPLQPSSGLWMEMGAIVAVATLVDCHIARTPCPNECYVPGTRDVVDMDYDDDTGQWMCDRCGYYAGSMPYTCCQPWGEPMHGTRRARHLVLANVRRLISPISASGKQILLWKLDPITAADVDVALEVAARRKREAPCG